MDWKLYWLFLTTNFFLCLTPGPAVMLVTGRAMTVGMARGQASVLGILAGNLFYCVVSAVGLGALFLASPLAISAVKYAGGAYLLYIGLRTLFSRSERLRFTAIGRQESAPALFRQAVLLQLSNPKSILFFGALLPQFVGAGWPSYAQMLVLGVSAIALEYPILTAYSALGAQLNRLQSPAAVRAIHLASGLLLVAVAVRVAMS